MRTSRMRQYALHVRIIKTRKEIRETLRSMGQLRGRHVQGWDWHAEDTREY